MSTVGSATTPSGPCFAICHVWPWSPKKSSLELARSCVLYRSTDVDKHNGGESKGVCTAHTPTDKIMDKYQDIVLEGLYQKSVVTGPGLIPWLHLVYQTRS